MPTRIVLGCGGDLADGAEIWGGRSQSQRESGDCLLSPEEELLVGQPRVALVPAFVWKYFVNILMKDLQKRS